MVGAVVVVVVVLLGWLAVGLGVGVVIGRFLAAAGAPADRPTAQRPQPAEQPDWASSA